MTTYKQNGKFYISGKIKRDDGTYYNYRRLATGARSIREAKDFETDFLRKYQDIQVAKQHSSFTEVAEQFLAHNRSQIKASSYRDKCSILKKVNSTIGAKKISLITHETLRKLFKQYEGAYTKNYVSKIYYTVNEVFDYAIIEGIIKENPLKRVKLATDKDTVKKEMLFWEPEQFDAFLQQVDDLQYQTFFTILYYMGVRKGEAQALQWKDIDLQAGSMYICKTFTSDPTGKNQKWAITPPKTQNSVRKISMPKVVRELLSAWKIDQKGMHGFSDDCFVFGFYRPLGRNTITKRFDKYYNRALAENPELPRIRIHDFRHSHASYLINNMSDKFTDFDIAKRLGDTVETLHDTYAHWFKAADKAIIEVIDGKQPEKFAELRELKMLADEGIITQEEFDIKKKEILGL